MDFETFYTGEYSVRAMGVYPYVRDRRFRAWAVAVSDGTRTVVKEPGAFPWAEINGLAWVSHNREFDKAVFLRLQEDGVIPQGVRPGVWHCTAAACAFLQYPRDLKGACREVLGIEVDKSVRAGLKGQKGADDLFAHSGMTAEEEKYTGNDAELCLKLWTALGWMWPEHERTLFEATCEMGARGVPVDWGRVEQAREELTVAARKLEAGIEWTPALSVDKFKKACAAYGVPAPASTGKGDANFGEWLKMYGNTPCGRMAANMASLRRTNRLVKLLETMGTRRKPDGRMAFELKYYGATTGRWSGGGGFNVQNLNRKEAAGLDIRSCFCAGAGEVFGVADYAQIEARVLLWLAGDQKTLRILHNPLWHTRSTRGHDGLSEEEPLRSIASGRALTRHWRRRVLGLGFRCAGRSCAWRRSWLGRTSVDEQGIVREYCTVTRRVAVEDLSWREAFDKGDDLASRSRHRIRRAAASPTPTRGAADAVVRAAGRSSRRSWPGSACRSTAVLLRTSCRARRGSMASALRWLQGRLSAVPDGMTNWFSSFLRRRPMASWRRSGIMEVRLYPGLPIRRAGSR